MFTDFHFVFTWWLTIFGLSLLSLPFVFYFFDKFWDHGYIFSKTLSIVLTTYLILVSGIFKILPFNNIGLFVIIIFLVLVDVLFLLNKKRYLWFLKIIKSKYKLFLSQELLFLTILTLWSYIRSFAPDIEGLEKYMDWGFVNSALRSKFLPPQDMWFSGEIINYYYFGHLIFALITKLSKISSSITYNLSIATVCSLTFVSTFSLASNLTFLSINKKKKTVPCPVKERDRKGFSSKKIIFAGLISALLLTFGGNLHSVYKIANLNFTQNNNKIVFTNTALKKAINAYWYPDATRFIGHDPDTKDKTIHEFPLYSFVVADLHGHMNDIIIVIFFMAFLLSSFIESKQKKNWQFIVFSGFILSLCYMTNAWDFAVYGLLLAIFTILTNFYQQGVKGLISTFFTGFMVILFWYLFSLPFSLKFIPMLEGIRISDGHSPFYQLFVLYGGFWLICFPFLIHLIYKLIKNFRFFRSKIQVVNAEFLSKDTIPTYRDKLKIKNSFTISDIFIATLIIAATILIIVPELVYLKDIYIYEHRRANTMFKLVYQSFILYSLCSGYVLVRLSEIIKSRILISIYKLIFALVFVIQLIYPYFAIKSYYGEFRLYHGLDGLTYLKDLYPDNYQAILWINKNITGQPVMLEAVGDSYTTFNQVSSATGLPTVQGWIVHEWLWRGGYDIPASRQMDVEKIYLSKDLEETQTLLSQYSVEYIFVGAKEYEKYPDIDPQKFKDIGGKVVFQSGKTVIYQL